MIRDKEKGKAKTTLYKPREGGINKNLNRFTPTQMEWIRKTCGEYLDFFNYNKGETNFFEGLPERTNGPSFDKLKEMTLRLACNPETATSKFGLF